MNLPIRIEIPKFVRKIKVSEKQKARYFEWNGIFIKGNKPIPISYFKDKKNIPKHPMLEHLKDEYSICSFKNKKYRNIFKASSQLPKTSVLLEEFKDLKFYLCKNNIPILSNPTKIGTPKYYLIKGQDIYSGNLREHFKGMVMDKIKQSYFPYVRDMPVIDVYPIKIDCELYDTIKNPYHKVDHHLGQRWDIDNYVYPYMKAFPDLLTSLKKIKDDDRLHLPSAIAVKFIPISNHEDRKLVFTISIDDREEIKNNTDIQNYHKDFNAGFHRNEDTGETEDTELRDLNLDALGSDGEPIKSPDTYGY